MRLPGMGSSIHLSGDPRRSLTQTGLPCTSLRLGVGLVDQFVVFHEEDLLVAELPDVDAIFEDFLVFLKAADTDGDVLWIRYDVDVVAHCLKEVFDLWEIGGGILKR